MEILISAVVGFLVGILSSTVASDYSRFRATLAEACQTLRTFVNRITFEKEKEPDVSLADIITLFDAVQFQFRIQNQERPTEMLSAIARALIHMSQAAFDKAGSVADDHGDLVGCDGDRTELGYFYFSGALLTAQPGWERQIMALEPDITGLLKGSLGALWPASDEREKERDVV